MRRPTLGGMQTRTIIGTAGWSIPAALADRFPAEGSQLQRYAAVMDGVEINSSFYRSHRPQTYERWAGSTPAHFRFAVKLPRQISHDGRLEGAAEPLARFVGETGALGRKWAVLLVQLPPSLVLDAAVAGHFFEQARAAFGGAIVCEPRHPSWFTPEAGLLMRQLGIARAGVDPAQWPGSAEPLAHRRLAYHRWHGSPRVYWSSYDEDWLQARRAAMRALPASTVRWCIFDNTASGAALQNALQLQALR